MSVVNISQGGNKLIQLLGLKDIQDRMKAISDAVVRDEAAEVVGDAAGVVRDAIYSNASAQNVPHRALDDIYIYTRQPNGQGKRDSIAALAGLRKKGRHGDAHGYVTWLANKQRGGFEKKSHRKHGASLSLPGTKRIGENLATMWEFGTTKMRARPFFRTAISSVRGNVLAIIANGYKAILERHSA